MFGSVCGAFAVILATDGLWMPFTLDAGRYFSTRGHLQPVGGKDEPAQRALRAGKSSASANPCPLYFLMIRPIFMVE
jgi:hypothetical protein